MSFKLLTLSFASVYAASSTITIKEDGKEKQLYVVGSGSAHGSSENKIEVGNDGRRYLATSDALGPDNFYKPNWLGGSLSYDMDLSQSKCGCNSALYLVSMPGKDESGNIHPATGDYYCDANQVDGTFCPEFDIQEANIYAWHSTPHKCDAPTDKGHYYNCDKGGQCFQIAQHTGDYGPGKKIDTTKPFNVKVEFDANDHFTTTLTQNGQTLTMNSECGSYYPQIRGDLKNGMAVVMSQWGGNMSWLDGDTGCQEQCQNNEFNYVSNIVITTGGDSPGPGPDPKPTDFEYGDACQSLVDDDCAQVSGCTSCNWSWPANDPAKWASKDAHCRCKTHTAAEFIQ